MSTPKTELQLAGHSQRKWSKGDEERERSEWEEIEKTAKDLASHSCQF